VIKMAWDPSKPEDDQLLVNFPSSCRAQWTAIALGTDSNLLITNAKCHSAMGLVDTKLAQITTYQKVHGSSLSNLSSVNSGGGRLPHVNCANVLFASGTDAVPGKLDELISSTYFTVTSELLVLKDNIPISVPLSAPGSLVNGMIWIA